MSVDNNSDLPGKSRFKLGFNSFLNLQSNTSLDHLFNLFDAALIFRIGECKANEVLYSKGHPTDPASGSWSILNENKALKVILHEANGVNSLVFKSVDAIFNTKRRITVGLNFFSSTKNMELFVNGLPQPFVLDTSQPHYRTNINQFTGLNVTSDSITVGRGLGQAYGEFGLYYDLCVSRVLTQGEHTTFYQPLIDSRILPASGTILFSSNRAGSNYSIFEMNDDGTNPVLKSYSGGSDRSPSYSKSSAGIYCFSNGSELLINKNGDLRRYPGLLFASLASFDMNTSYCYYLTPNGGNGGGRFLHVDMTNMGSGYTFGNAHTSNLFSGVTGHPTSPDLFASVYSPNYYYNPLSLVIGNRYYNTYNTLFTLPYGGASGIGGGVNLDRQIFNFRFSKDGTKVGFCCYYAPNLTSLRSYIINSDGSNLTLIGHGESFCDFITNTKILLSKPASGPGYTNKSQIFIRDLITNEEINITNHNSDNIEAVWRPAS